MFFGRWRRRDPTEKRWLELAEGLGLQQADAGQALLLDLLDLPVGASLGPVFRVDQSGDAHSDWDVYLFYHRQTAVERMRQLPCVTGCLLVTQSQISPVSWRASRKIHNVIAALQASATGGQVTLVPGADEFNQRVTVVARHGEQAVALLTPPVRRVLERVLNRVDPPPTLTVGEQRILLTAPGSEVAFGTVEFLLSDVLSLFVALEAR
ncbi:MAG: hypothetical protein WD273_04780 [Trueperaceae bacterium]